MNHCTWDIIGYFKLKVMMQFISDAISCIRKSEVIITMDKLGFSNNFVALSLKRIHFLPSVSVFVRSESDGVKEYCVRAHCALI